MFRLLAMEFELPLPVWYSLSLLRVRSRSIFAPRSTPSRRLRSTASCGVRLVGWQPHAARSCSAGDRGLDCENDWRETLCAERAERCSCVRAGEIDWGEPYSGCSGYSSVNTSPKRGVRHDSRRRVSVSSLWCRGSGGCCARGEK